MDAKTAFRTERERELYRVFHNQGSVAFAALFGPEDFTGSRLMNRWASKGLMRITDTPTGQVYKTFKKYAA
jgi:hypothetical protein